MSRETVLTYTNDRGLSMSLAPLTNFFLLTCKETLTNDIQSQKLRALDGEHFDGSTLGTRHIEITGYFKAIGNRREMERTLTRTFNINTSGELTHRRTGTDRSFAIGCRLEQLPDVEFDGSQINFTINLVCHNPYWHGTPTKEDISMIVKLGRFPLIIPRDTKFVFGYRAQTLKATFDNIGDAVAGAVYTLKADGGTVTNPSISHTNSGKVLKIFHTLQNGENIVVTSRPDYVGIAINKVDGTTLNGMSLLSDQAQRKFFMIDIGENTIEYNADSNVTNLSVLAEYTPLYLGVY